jgi:hypothetical protein
MRRRCSASGGAASAALAGGVEGEAVEGSREASSEPSEAGRRDSFGSWIIIDDCWVNIKVRAAAQRRDGPGGRCAYCCDHFARLLEPPPPGRKSRLRGGGSLAGFPLEIS